MVRRRHIKAVVAASGALLDDIRDFVAPSRPQGPQDECEHAIDVLVRNALSHDIETGPDVSRVWTELSSRVMGPFGMLALEGPAFCYTDDGAPLSFPRGRDTFASHVGLSLAASDVYALPSPEFRAVTR